MVYRLAYGFLVLLLLSIFSLLMSLKMVPYEQSRYRYEPVALNARELAIAWAVDRGTSPEVAALPVQVPEAFRFGFPYVNMQNQVEDTALKILVKARLPEAAAYVLKLSGKRDTVTLPLARQQDGTWSTPAFIALEANDTARYFHGVRVFHVHGEPCALAVERVVKM